MRLTTKKPEKFSISADFEQKSKTFETLEKNMKNCSISANFEPKEKIFEILLCIMYPK
jgi:hypothetical protein